ncbi:hypothetical protein L7F22_019543 [Adiantum nelumboides]|nr:hypothetical protein [Adiantum nelumboides]
MTSVSPNTISSSEQARNLLSQKLQSIQQKSPNTVSPAPLQTKEQTTSNSPSQSNNGINATLPTSKGFNATPKEADAIPTSHNTGTPLPPLAPLPAPKALSQEEITSKKYVVPQKRIVSPGSMKRWQESKTFDEILGFVMACNDAVVGQKLTEKIEQSPAVEAIMSILNTIMKIVEEVPPEDGSSSRFGNPAFRTFYGRVKEQSRELHNRIPTLQSIKGQASVDKTNEQEGQTTDAIGEIQVYFDESFGNEKRIDYGSGMELNFACWLLCLVKLGILDIEREAPAIVLRIFWRYIEVMRAIQSTYWLEPAGSHGVWGLDDYHFLPFLWGSAQLKGHKIFRPKSIHDDEILSDFGKDYMYFACIHFINSIKTASLRWHSPMLDDISGVKTWAKVNEGMIKMYKAEVLLKLPIAQHIFFGSLLAFPQTAHEDEKEEEDQALQEAVQKGGIVHTDANGHSHVHAPIVPGGAEEGGPAAAVSGWGDCCGIPIPSAFAAAQQEREKMKGAGNLRFEGSSNIRRIPFD